LHERFVHLIGQPPTQYLAQWRMQVAARLLRDTKAKLIELAFGVGVRERGQVFVRVQARRGALPRVRGGPVGGPRWRRSGFAVTWSAAPFREIS
jgi:AraC-like DNA-binding protein